MRALILSLAAVAAALAAGAPASRGEAHAGPPAAAGSIRGRVELPAPPPPERRPAVAQIGASPRPAGAEDAADRRVSVVYLDRAPRSAFGDFGERRVRIDQRNERFVPHVVAITVGSVVDFPNSDRTYHNVFSLSDAKTFDLGRYAEGRSKAVRFDRPGIVRVFCDIHSHMSAFVLVFAHRFFAVTDDEGRYRIGDVPPGTYTLTVWNETIEPESRQVTVPDGGEVEQNFLLGAGSRAAGTLGR